MRRALGKGLSQLLGEQAEESSTVSTLPVSSIVPNSRQPRMQFDDSTLAELAASIREFGVLQPLIVRPVGEDRYELIAGERRLRACKMAGLSEVPVVVRSASAQAALEIALIENVQREDISAMECAIAYNKLCEEFSLSHEEVAGRVGKSRVAVSNTLRLLKLPAALQKAVMEGDLSEGHARALLMLDSPVRQAQLFERVLRDGLSVRETERLARSASEEVGRSMAQRRKHQQTNPEWASLERGLSEYFGSKVTLHRERSGGKVTLEFYSDDDLQRILDILGVSL